MPPVHSTFSFFCIAMGSCLTQMSFSTASQIKESKDFCVYSAHNSTTVLWSLEFWRVCSPHVILLRLQIYKTFTKLSLKLLMLPYIFINIEGNVRRKWLKIDFCMTFLFPISYLVLIYYYINRESCMSSARLCPLSPVIIWFHCI